MQLAKDKARHLVNNYSIGGGAVTIVPIPGGHSVGLTVAEASLAVSIAKLYGIKPVGIVWTYVLKFIMLKCGGSFLLKLLGEGLTFIPIVGWFAKSLIATSAIKGFGELVILYFESKFPNHKADTLPSFSEVFKAFGGAIAVDILQDWYSKHYK